MCSFQLTNSAGASGSPKAPGEQHQDSPLTGPDTDMADDTDLVESWIGGKAPFMTLNGTLSVGMRG